MTTPAAWVEALQEQAFEPLTDVEQLGDDLLGAAHLLQLLVAGDGFGQCRRGCRVIGDELGDAVGLTVGHAQHSADVADDGAGLQLAEGDDLRNPVGAVLIADVGDDLAAPVLAEVDVEVGHRHPLGVEEALEKQVEGQGIDIGDGQAVGNQRTCPRTCPGPTGIPCPWPTG